MSERNFSTDGIERRGFVTAVAAGVGGLALSGGSLARTPIAEDAADVTDAKYVVEQGGDCVPVTPLSGDETVESFYDYRTPNTSPSGLYSSYGTTDLQKPETSALFLYDGPDGLSLVVLHDKLRDETPGGSVTFDFDGLTGGEWLVGDDVYDAPSNYDRFRQTDDGWQVDWTWSSGRSDGGVYGTLGDDFAVTVKPAFNEAAALHGEYYDGEITDWQVLSGDGDDPERVSLSMDEPITIRPGSCASVGAGADAHGSSVDADVSVVQGRVNPRSNGHLPVVVRSTAEFDATTVDTETVAFGPDGATPTHSSRADVNGDGRPDLLLKFRLPATGIDWDTEQASLTGETREGRAVHGTAEIPLVPEKGDDDDGDEQAKRDEEDEETREDERDDEAEKEREDEKEEREEKKEKREKDDDDEDDDKSWKEDVEEEAEEAKEKAEKKREKAEEKAEKKREKAEEKAEQKKKEWDDRDEERGKRGSDEDEDD